MEKIQEAIAKARATREATPGPAAAAVEGQAAAPPAMAEIDTAWNALPGLQPNTARLARSRIVTLTGSREATPFDVMRTKLLQQMRANNWRRLAITSPTAACGKSTIALNLAFSLARQPDVRTLLIELDLRRPSMARTLGITADKSVARILQGERAFADEALRHGANMAVAVNSGAARNPAELLHGSGISARLAAIEAQYEPELVIFDMPPMLVSDDAMAFVGQVDCVLLVAGAEATTIKEVDICERELATQTNVMGVVLNKCRFMGPEYGYGYGYGYGN